MGKEDKEAILSGDIMDQDQVNVIELDRSAVSFSSTRTAPIMMSNMRNHEEDQPDTFKTLPTSPKTTSPNGVAPTEAGGAFKSCQTSMMVPRRNTVGGGGSISSVSTIDSQVHGNLVP
eukprot:sb/3476422/